MLDDYISNMREEIVEKVRECVKIESVEDTPKDNMPFGEGVNNALMYALKLSKDLGFKAVNRDNMVGYAEYGSGKEMVAVLGHLDVVPAGDGWTYPPFDAEIHNGKIYGRGVLDDKGATIGSLFALKAIKDLNIPLSKRVRIIFGTNEETGSKCMKHYSQIEETPVAGFTPDAQYPIINGEKGIINCTFKKILKNNHGMRLVKIKGGTAPNVVPSYAEAVIDCDESAKRTICEAAKGFKGLEIEDGSRIIVKVHGVPAHGSTPELGVNAISILIEFLSNLGFEGSLKDFLCFMNDAIGKETNGKKLGIYIKDEVSGELTVNLGTIDGDEDGIEFKLNIRYPVTKKYDDFMGTLLDKMGQAGIESTFISHKHSLYVNPDTDYIKKLQKVYAEKTGKEAHLLSIGGGTYAKSLKNIVAFGPIFEGEPDLDHKPDEYMSIDGLIKNVQIIAAAICELAK